MIKLTWGGGVLECANRYQRRTVRDIKGGMARPSAGSGSGCPVENRQKFATGGHVRRLCWIAAFFGRKGYADASARGARFFEARRRASDPQFDRRSGDGLST